jgi:spore germination protein YaaH
LYLELGTYVCVDILGSTASSSTITTTHNTITTPSPIQTSMVTDCDKFYDVQSGDGCAAIASTESIPLASFYAWNPAVGTACADLFLSYYVCVGVATVSATTTSSTTASSTKASVTPPAPTQSGIPSDCDAYAITESGDGCEAFATRNGITLANLCEFAIQ